MQHFRLHTHQLTEAELLLGREAFVLHGAGPLKKRKDIGPHNVLVQMVNFHAYSGAVAPASMTAPVRVLKRMLHSGKYFASPTWAYRGQGRGMDEHKFEAIWKTAIANE